jgi:hypothetical protein
LFIREANELAAVSKVREDLVHAEASPRYGQGGQRFDHFAQGLWLKLLGAADLLAGIGGVHEVSSMQRVCLSVSGMQNARTAVRTPGSPDAMLYGGYRWVTTQSFCFASVAPLSESA